MMNNNVKRFSLFTLIFSFVILVNISVIAFNLVYVEQPELYLANQQIVSFQDLFNIYLHPNMLNLFYIPFFRPSGHFLLYQLLMPVLGWHNTKALIVVNLFFLALTGYFIIQLYNLLFPRYKMGGYIAFAFYLMHPALILSRLISLHFEFAYVFLVILSTYYFVLFCKKNIAQNKSDISSVKFQYFKYLMISLLIYSLAITFKEPAIMIGPVLALYFCIDLYSGQPLLSFTRHVVKNKQTQQILLLLTVVSLTLAMYLSFQWSAHAHPAMPHVQWKAIIATINEYVKIILASPYNFIPAQFYQLPASLWREIAFPAFTRILVWLLIIPTLISVYLIRKEKNAENTYYQKSLVFLFISALLFLTLPIAWSMANPWHLSLSLLYLGLALGFGFEYFTQHFIKNKKLSFAISGIIAIIIGLNTFSVNHDNIRSAERENGFSFKLARNAVLNPPDIKNKLNADSVIVVEDSTYNDGYILGNLYPITFLNNIGQYDFNQIDQLQSHSYFKFRSIYAGTFFRWAYLMPTLKEEVVAFQIDNMKTVPNIVIYNWLLHYDNIFCLGYDSTANWQDRTGAFKKKLLAENAKRHLIVNAYKIAPAETLSGNVTNTTLLPFPEPELCKLNCDQDKSCSGFTYINVESHGQSIKKCYFFGTLSVASNKKTFCPACTSFTKRSS